MNLILFAPHELGDDGTVTLTERRAEHILRVLGSSPGDTLRAGVLDVGYGDALITATTATTVGVRYREQRRVEQCAPRVLILALPRPKVLSRCLQHAAALGYTTIALVRCQRSEKAHLSSSRLDDERTRNDCLLGLEQGGHVVMPAVTVFTRFKPFVEDSLDELAPKEARFVAHPGAAAALDVVSHLRPDEPQRYTLAIGPEGGFVPFELECLTLRGFRSFGSNTGALRVETALSYFSGQLDAVAPPNALNASSLRQRP